jgi:hypothetical protein
MAAQSFITHAAKRRILQIRSTLTFGRKTAEEISKAISLSKRAVCYYMNHLRRCTPRQVHICGWTRPDGSNVWAPVFALGDKADKPRPPRKSAAQRMRDARRRINADPERFFEYRKKEELRNAIRRPRKKKPPADPMLAWIPRRDQQHKEAA